ncbi:MAG TPA: serine/threonine dehydratase [Nocardioidaceae bacterium]|nr:serine/threonine dehydratase [Nocardioidaceae bacterium]
MSDLAWLPDRDDVEVAAARLDGQIRRTPVLRVDGEELGVAGNVVLKLELTQHTGSFKARGALNSVLSLPDGVRGVTAASGGNHGAALAWAARRSGLAADIFVSAASPPEKIDRIRGFGATAHVIDGYYPEAFAAADTWARDRDVTAVHAYDQHSTVCGQGTVGLEVATQVPGATRVLVACGGGGLYAGVATALAGRVPVTPVEPERCASLQAALAAGERVPVDVGGVAADALGAATIGAHAFAVATELDAEPVIVSDDDILVARRWLWERCRVLAEPGAAAPVAALLTGAVAVPAGETAVAVISGGNNPTIP